VKYWHLRYASTNSVWIMSVVLEIKNMQVFRTSDARFPFFIVDVCVSVCVCVCVCFTLQENIKN
jgi:hypothetical protein